jgi:hypothetical protein
MRTAGLENFKWAIARPTSQTHISKRDWYFMYRSHSFKCIHDQCGIRLWHPSQAIRPLFSNDEGANVLLFLETGNTSCRGDSNSLQMGGRIGYHRILQISPHLAGTHQLTCIPRRNHSPDIWWKLNQRRKGSRRWELHPSASSRSESSKRN